MEKKSRKSASRWQVTSERALISIWRDKINELQETRKNSHILVKMVAELKKRGFSYTVEELKTKMHNMSARYRKEKRKIKRLNVSSSEWILFQEMHTLLARLRSYHSENLEEDSSSGLPMKFECISLPSSATRAHSAKNDQKVCRSLLDSASKSVSTQRCSETFATDTLQSYPNEMAKLDEKIGFIGGGNMAFAIGSGLITRGIVKPGQVLVSGPNLENLTRWSDLGAETTEDNYEVLDKSDIIFICVKPHILTPCATQLRSVHEPTTKDKDKLFVSVLAGVNLKTLEESFNFIVGLKMIRTMPNTSMQVGEGCTVYTAGTYVKQHDLEKVHLMLNSLGIAQKVPESMIDAVTGLAGCGPAYVYTFIESLADGAVKQGVPRQMALQFGAQMVLGAAKTVLVTGRHPAVLRDEVCSPGGSTIVGVHELEKGSFRATVINAVEMSSKRSAELGKK